MMILIKFFHLGFLFLDGALSVCEEAFVLSVRDWNQLFGEWYHEEQSGGEEI